MVYRNYASCFRTSVFISTCAAIFCTFYWDLSVLDHAHKSRRSWFTNEIKMPKPGGWTWECTENIDSIKVCRRVIPNKTSQSHMSLETCKMTCSPGRNIWPIPAGDVKIKNTSFPFHPHGLNIKFTSGNNFIFINKAIIFKERVMRLIQNQATSNVGTKVNITLVLKDHKTLKYKLNIDESYKLLVSRKGKDLVISIKASNFIGAHHGLEALLQLMWYDEKDRTLKVYDNAMITDSPLFSYRGLLLDTSSTFIPIPTILKTIEAMSMCKLNVFHWHMTGSKSFPFASEKFPKFKEYGLYSPEESYSPEEIMEVEEFAEVRGVYVLVEVDAPSHSAQGWEWGGEEGKGNLTLCTDAEPYSSLCVEPPCGQLNPANYETYTILGKVLKEINEVTDSKNLLHLGGDDVNLKCWESSQEVSEMEVFINKGMAGVWELFYQQLLDKFSFEKIKPANYIIWSNNLLKNSQFWKSLKIPLPIVQFKGSSSSGELEKLVLSKHKVIVSSSDQWFMEEPKSWMELYKYRPWMDLKLQQRKLVIGGEACAWTDRLDHHTLSPSIWPKLAAVAERLWSDPSGAPPSDRLASFRERLVMSGVIASPVLPRWCVQNPYECS